MARASDHPIDAAKGTGSTEPAAKGTGSAEPSHGLIDTELDEHVRWALEQWPEIDPEVEGIVTRIDKIDRYLQQAAMSSLARVGLTHAEFKVLIALKSGQRSHGSLCRDLLISTGAMTNRLDKLEQAGLVQRARDPHDRRGVLLGLTAAGRAKLDEYIDLGADRERQLLRVLELDEKQDLNRLLRKLLGFLGSELGQPPPRSATSSTD